MSGELETGSRQLHRALAAAALLLGLLAALVGEPAGRARERAGQTPGTAAADSVPPDSTSRLRLDGRRGCAW